MRPLPLCALALALVVVAGPALRGQSPPAAFDGFVDEFLETFAARHPSIAAGNGLHQHDDTLEDMSAPAIAAELAGWRALKVRLAGITAASLTPDQRADHRILDGLLDAWILDIDTTRSWQKNLMVYAAALSDGVHNLMTMASAPAPLRAERIVRKLQGVPALLAAARTNLVRPPRVMTERGIRMLRGAAGMLRTDVALAFADGLSPAEKARLLEACTRTAGEIEAFADWFANERLPQADATVRGRPAPSVEARYRAEELIDMPAATLLAIGERELAKAQAAFDAAAARVDRARPAARGVGATS